jgi:hypothetical protein
MLNGVKIVTDDWWIGGFALGESLSLLGSRQGPAMFFSSSFSMPLRIFPPAILGSILFLTGWLTLKAAGL